MVLKKITRFFEKKKEPPKVAFQGPKVDMKGKKFILYLTGFTNEQTQHEAIKHFISEGKSRVYSEMKEWCQQDNLPMILDAFATDKEAEVKKKAYENLGCILEIREQKKMGGFDIH